MNKSIWKYITTDQCNDFLLSFNLLAPTNLSPEKQLACLYAVSNSIESHYTTTYLKKKTGGHRVIHEPSPLLKKIQKNILVHVLEPQSCSVYATAYQKEKSLLDNAAPHIGKKQVYKLDIDDFFDSISFTMVFQRAFPREYFPPQAAGILTQLCCFNDCLPQGAPTSPMISNLVLKPFDDYIGQWCRERNIAYTRYCDDMTFSGEFNVKKLHHKVRAFLEALDFSLNQKKTKLLATGKQQIVTGITVNEKMQVPKKYRREVRQSAYYCLNYGTASHLKRMNEGNGELDPETYLNSLLGKINFILSVNPSDKEFSLLKEEISKLLSHS